MEMLKVVELGKEVVEVRMWEVRETKMQEGVHMGM